MKLFILSVASFFVLGTSVSLYAFSFDLDLAERLHGYILLQVEEHGEAWYVRSDDSKRYYMEDGSAAYTMMRYFSLGISDADLEKIPAVDDTTEMLSSSSVCDSNSLADRLSGEILLQVEQHGEAWYIYPGTCLRIYLEDGDAAYSIMRFLGLGIVNTDLEKIERGESEPPSDVTVAEPFSQEHPTATQSPVFLLADEDAGEMVIDGRYADMDIVQLSDGTWKMYFGVEPEVEGTQFEIYSASSADGLVWDVRANDALLTWSTFPDVLLLEDGTLRMYMQQAGEIYSGISSDGGESFTMEAGVRVEQTGDKDTDGVGAPTVLALDSGGYLMVFRTAEQGAYQSTSINSTTTTFFLATSDDGLDWERGGIVVDSRQEPYDGYIDGPELFYNVDGNVELRFWTSGVSNNPSTSGHYRMVSLDEGGTWSDAEQFSSIMGGDPTYAFIDNILYMYYTIHTEGIYMKTL